MEMKFEYIFYKATCKELGINFKGIIPYFLYLSTCKLLDELRKDKKYENDTVPHKITIWRCQLKDGKYEEKQEESYHMQIWE